MSNGAAQKAILQALIEGILTDLNPKTTGEMVYLDDNTTLATKLTELIQALNTKATTQSLTEGLAGKAAATHGHEQGDISGLADALNAKVSNTALADAIAALRTELMGEGVPEAYDTFKEIYDYILDHADVATALNNAIGQKADKSVVDAIQAVTDALGDLSTKDKVSEADVDAALLEKINAASQGNHSHTNKALLDTYDQTNASIKDAVNKKHGHDNKTVLDGITQAKVNGWDAKSRVLVDTTQPADMAAGDLLIKLIQ